MNEEEKVVSKSDLEQDGEITLLNGEPFSGVCTDYHKNGQKFSEPHYKNGKKDGLSTVWYDDGQKRIEGHYKNGLEEGLSWVPDASIS